MGTRPKTPFRAARRRHRAIRSRSRTHTGLPIKPYQESGGTDASFTDPPDTDLFEIGNVLQGIGHILTRPNERFGKELLRAGTHHDLATTRGAAERRRAAVGAAMAIHPPWPAIKMAGSLSALEGGGDDN